MPEKPLAVILAAGAGTRLRPLTDQQPKCLLEVGGRTLLDYQLQALASQGIEDVLVVTGHCAEQIRERYRDRVRTMHDPDFETTNNLHSLWTARQEVAGREFLCLHADVLFHPQILLPCLQSSADVTVVLDPAFVEETLKARVRDGQVVEVSKQIPRAEVFGTFLGIVRFSAQASAHLPTVLTSLIEDETHRNSYFTACLPGLARQGHSIGCSVTGGLPWVEVDTEADLEVAENETFPAISESYLL